MIQLDQLNEMYEICVCFLHKFRLELCHENDERSIEKCQLKFVHLFIFIYLCLLLFIFMVQDYINIFNCDF